MGRTKQSAFICCAALLYVCLTVNAKHDAQGESARLRSVAVRHQKWSEQRAAFIRKQIRLQTRQVRELPVRQPPADDARHDSYPFVSGDTYRSVCHWVFDETGHRDWYPSEVGAGDLIFVKTDMLDHFFSAVHPYISEPYILISSNSDHPSPGPHILRLNDSHLSAWFGQNGDAQHPKFHPLPIGFPNREWEHGNLATLLHKAMDTSLLQKLHLVYVNLGIGSNRQRKGIVDHLRAWKTGNIPYFGERGSHDQYLTDMKQSVFVLSPPGNGIDCHRTWEAVLMGSVPIVLSSFAFGALAESSPIWVVDDFSHLTPAELDAYRHTRVDAPGVFANYWFRLFKQASLRAYASRQQD